MKIKKSQLLTAIAHAYIAGQEDKEFKKSYIAMRSRSQKCAQGIFEALRISNMLDGIVKRAKK